MSTQHGKSMSFDLVRSRIGSPRPSAGEGNCERIENRLLPALSVRRSARATQVERALRARFHLWIRRRAAQGWLNSIFSQLQGLGGEGDTSRLNQLPKPTSG